MAESSNKTRVACCFFLKRKHRYCKMIPGKGKKYCGEHSYLAEGNDDDSGRKRIPCPLDTKHTVFEDQLQKHLKKCNVTKKRRVEYYVANINGGITHERALCEKLALRQISKADIQKCIDKINLHFQGSGVDVKTSILTESCLENEMNNMSCNPTLRKHLHQQSSLIGNLRTAELLTSESIFVEFGAGRGMLSHWIQKSMPDESNVDFLLVDRASTRYKADSYHRGPDQGPSFHRVQIDIEHLNLSKVPLISKSRRGVTGVSKHLCGAATDLALRCFVNLSDSQECSNHEQTEEAEERSSKRLKLEHSRVRGLVFALCCHHCCSWASYVGREFLENLGFTPYYFHILCCLSSWATCGSRKKAPTKSKMDIHTDITSGQRLTSDTANAVEEGEEKQPDENSDCLSELKDGQEHAVVEELDEGSCIKALGLSKSESEEIGRRCKRLIDAGRIWYLEQHDLDSSLVYYVDRSVSLENVALKAWNRQHKVKKKGKILYCSYKAWRTSLDCYPKTVP